MSVLPPITAEQSGDADEVEALIAAAFGPGRFAKAAERLREGNHPDLSLSVVAREDGKLAGCARMWPIHVGGQPAILLGPFAVAASMRSRGLGAALVEAACERARAAGHSHVLLVGDAPYFDKLGFVRAMDVLLPGPVDRRRVLDLKLKADAGPLAGPVTS